MTTTPAARQVIRIVKWREYQHYSDRDPPWIKLHRGTLSGEMWVSSDDASRVLAVALMLLAAKTGNRIPLNPSYIRRVAYLNTDPDFSALLAAGFIEIVDENEIPASSPQAEASKTKPTAIPETERETEKRKKQRKKDDTAPSARAPSKYAFDGEVIRLSAKDFDKWRSVYSAIPDMTAELTAMDDWIRGEPEESRKRWFHVVSGALKKKHTAIAANALLPKAGAKGLDF